MDPYDLGPSIHHQVDYLWIEMVTAPVLDQLPRLGEREGASIDAVAGDGVENVRYSRDPSLDRDSISLQATGVAGPVDPFVVC